MANPITSLLFLLRRSYLRMSQSGEAFFVLKTNFATSHAVLSLCHWLVGIGDRHPSNFMIDRTTGNSVGIDFGHAFGSATQVTCHLCSFAFISHNAVISML